LEDLLMMESDKGCADSNKKGRLSWMAHHLTTRSTQKTKNWQRKQGGRKTGKPTPAA